VIDTRAASDRTDHLSL